MIRLKIDFIKEEELNQIIKLIELEYEIIEKSVIKNSKKIDSKFKTQFVDIIKK